MNADHREHIYDIFLPLDPCQTVVGKKQETTDAAGGHLQHALRRTCLKHFLNGNIQDESCVQHFCWSPVDRQELLAQMKLYLVPALLPNRCPVLNRSKWLGAEMTYSWIGILLLHHGLLSKLMLAWKGRAHPIPVSPENISDGPAPGPGLGPLWQGCGKVASKYVPAAGPTTSKLDLEARPLGAGPFGENPKDDDDDDDAAALAGSGSDNEFVAPLCYDPVTGDIDWHESNKANIGKARALKLALVRLDRHPTGAAEEEDLKASVSVLEWSWHEKMQMLLESSEMGKKVQDSLHLCASQMFDQAAELQQELAKATLQQHDPDCDSSWKAGLDTNADLKTLFQTTQEEKNVCSVDGEAVELAVKNLTKASLAAKVSG